MEKKNHKKMNASEQVESSGIVELGGVEELTGTFNTGKAHDDNQQSQMDRKTPTP